jgi:hypothetical protein
VDWSVRNLEKPGEADGIYFAPREMTDGKTDFFRRAPLGLISLAAMLGCLWRGLNLSGGGYNLAALAIVGAVFCLLSCGLRGNRKLAPVIAVLALAIYTAAAHRPILDGLNITMNQVFDGMEFMRGRIFPRYEIAGGAPELRATMFMALPAALLGLAAGGSSDGKPVFQLVSSAILAAATFAGVYVPDAWTAALCLTAAVVCARGVTRRNNFRAGGAALWGIAAVAVLAGISLIPALLFGDGSAAAESRRIRVSREIYSLRYEPEKQILPRGDFRLLGSFEPDESRAVMTVTVSEPAELYLRGFVGERYVGDGWAELPAAQKARSTKEFSWLHDRGFFAQNQTALLADALRLKAGTSTVSVRNETAGAGCVYAPYELIGGEPDPEQIGDADLPASGLRGQREYTYEVTSRSVSDYDVLFEALTAARRAEDKDVTEYLESENVFREYVYANYLDVPQEAAAAVRKMLGGEIPAGGADFETAKEIVRDYAAYAIEYSETPPKYVGGDFMTYLADGGQGYDPHYATAAVLMFRSLGIPARYVEGWHIPEADATVAAENGVPVGVTQASAHAWAEIYRDGVGFVPFEVTPTDAAVSQTVVTQENVSLTDEEEEPPEQINWLKILLLVLLALVALLVICFAALAIRRRIRLMRWERMLGESPPDTAAEQLTAYIVCLLGRMGISHGNGSLYGMADAIGETLGRDTAAAFSEVIAVQQRARFSAMPPDSQRSGEVYEFAGGIAKKLRERSKLHARFRLKYIECLI